MMNHISFNLKICDINIVCTIMHYAHTTFIIVNVHHLVAFLSPGIGYRAAVFEACKICVFNQSNAFVLID